MATKITIPELLQRNKTYTQTHHQHIPTFAALTAAGAGPSGYVIITCADPRCIPENFLNLSMTDGVVVFRNVGGHVEPVIKDLLAFDGFFGITDVLVVHHTDCGTTHFKDEKIREGLIERLPGKRGEIEGMTFGAVDDLEQSVRDDLAIFKSSPYIRKELADHCFGFVYDLETGGLTSVES